MLCVALPFILLLLDHLPSMSIRPRTRPLSSSIPRDDPTRSALLDEFRTSFPSLADGFNLITNYTDESSSGFKDALLAFMGDLVRDLFIASSLRSALIVH